MDIVQQAQTFYELHKMKKGKDFRLEFLKLDKELMYDYLDNINQDRIHEWRAALQTEKLKTKRLEEKIEQLESELDEYKEKSIK